MMQMYWCNHCQTSHYMGEGCPAITFACSAVDGGASECVAPAEVRSVAADGFPDSNGELCSVVTTLAL